METADCQPHKTPQIKHAYESFHMLCTIEQHINRLDLGGWADITGSLI